MRPLLPSSPHIIAMVGAPGSGKTQFVSEFAKIFNAPVIDASQFEALTDDTKLISDMTLSILDEFLKTKHTVILDGATDQRTTRIKINRMARERGYKVLLVWVQTDLATAKNRWMKQSGGDELLFERRLKQFSPPHDSESYAVISGRHTFSTQARAVLKHLSISAPRPEVHRELRVNSRIDIG